MIINEPKQAKELLEHGFVKHMSLQDLTLVAKHYKAEGCSNSQIRKELIIFCNKFNPEFNEVIHAGLINTALSNAEKYSFRIPENVKITQKEMDIIQGLKDYKLEKITFILLVLAKYYKDNKVTKKKISGDVNKNYYTNAKFTEILRLAKVNISKAERYYTMNLLYKLGIWEATYFGTHRIKCVRKTGAVVMEVDLDVDISKVVEQYAKYKKDNGLDNEIEYKCVDCGDMFIRNSKAAEKIRCKKCTSLRRKETNRENVKKFRLRNKA